MMKDIRKPPSVVSKFLRCIILQPVNPLTSKMNTIFTHIARMHDVTLTHAHTFCIHARKTRRIHTPVCVGKTCTPCAVSASLGRTTRTQCRSQPPVSTGPGHSHREMELSREVGGTGTRSNARAMRVTTHPQGCGCWHQGAPSAIRVYTPPPTPCV